MSQDITITQLQDGAPAASQTKRQRAHLRAALAPDARRIAGEKAAAAEAAEFERKSDKTLRIGGPAWRKMVAGRSKR